MNATAAVACGPATKGGDDSGAEIDAKFPPAPVTMDVTCDQAANGQSFAVVDIGTTAASMPHVRVRTCLRDPVEVAGPGTPRYQCLIQDNAFFTVDGKLF